MENFNPIEKIFELKNNITRKGMKQYEYLYYGRYGRNKRHSYP